MVCKRVFCDLIKTELGQKSRYWIPIPKPTFLWWDLKYALMQSKTHKNPCLSPSLISLGLVGVTHDATANQCFEGKTINSLFINNILLLTSGHCWIKSRKPWGPGAVQWLSRLDFQRPSVANISFRANILGRNTNCFPHPENSTRKGTEIKRGEREGGKLCQLKISFNLTSEFYFHSHHPNLRHTVSSLKDYNDILTGLMAFFLAPIGFTLHTAVSGAVHRYNLIALLLQWPDSAFRINTKFLIIHHRTLAHAVPSRKNIFPTTPALSISEFH